ncbi:SID1 transmembrane family member 2 [Hypsibius exemplaris]|uniref:SID1 transmembrane family member 2 n=1 Tax=Hypsibius exemplaris TaxID=2072580 RepID=A0A1W0X3C9_HYPEX|nr:SID1 transmembrane family member 2 [Hypsibius exemplaris]
MVPNGFTQWVSVCVCCCFWGGCGVLANRNVIVSQYNVTLDRWYSGTVTANQSITFIFDYQVPVNYTRALRLQLVSQFATSAEPLLVVVREVKRVTSWEIPFYLEKTYPYWSVRRTLCPARDYLDYILGAVGNGTVKIQQQLSVDITTQSEKPVDYSFNIWFVPGYLLKTEREIDFRISPSSPAIFQYQMPEGIDRVLVRAWSPKPKAKDDKTICSYLSVQPAYCPVADLPGDITSQGEYQTFTTQGAIIVKREDFHNGKFDVVLVALSEDYRCREMMDLTPQLQKDSIDIAKAIERNLSGEWDDTTLFKKRQKHVFLVVENVLKPFQYAVATLSVLGFYFLFYLAFRIALCFGFMTTKTVNVPERETPIESMDEAEKGEKCLRMEDDGEIETTKKGKLHVEFANGMSAKSEKANTANAEKTPLQVKQKDDKPLAANAVHDGLEMTDVFPTNEQTIGNRMNVTDEEVQETENPPVDPLELEHQERDKYRASLAGKAIVTVTEVSLRPIVQIGKRDRAYNWTLLIIAIFYALPVVQLVLTYQRVMKSTGNMDLCYYNFKCAHPLGRLNDFNHIFSNIGYVLLGALFVLIVWKRQTAHDMHEREANRNEEETSLGLPPQYGLFYAMGFSLIMEGVMSACYHICPNYSNFQFDTSFMYLLGGLFLLKMYQSRHADISPNAQLAYAVFAFWIFLAVIGVVIDKQWFWTAFAVVLIVGSIPLGIQMYYNGQLEIRSGHVQSLFRDAPREMYGLQSADGDGSLQSPDDDLRCQLADGSHWSHICPD